MHRFQAPTLVFQNLEPSALTVYTFNSASRYAGEKREAVFSKSIVPGKGTTLQWEATIQKFQGSETVLEEFKQNDPNWVGGERAVN